MSTYQFNGRYNYFLRAFAIEFGGKTHVISIKYKLINSVSQWPEYNITRWYTSEESKTFLRLNGCIKTSFKLSSSNSSEVSFLSPRLMDIVLSSHVTWRIEKFVRRILWYKEVNNAYEVLLYYEVLFSSRFWTKKIGYCF